MNLSNTKNLEENKRIGLQRLANAPVNTDNLFIPLKDRTKQCVVDFTQEQNRINGSQINQNYAVLAKGQLHFIDLDNVDEAPDKLLKHTVDTFSVSSPHGSHRWIVCKDVLPNIKQDWGEIRSQNQYVVGPGSMLKDCDNDCCSSDNPGIYSIKNNAPIQEVTKDELSDWIGGFEKESVDGFSEDIELNSLSEESERLQTAQEVLSDLQSEHSAFFSDLMDRLNGGRGNMGDSLTKEEGTKIDRSRLDFVNLSHLYGVFRQYGKSHNESRGLAGATYSYYSQETPYTKDGQKRKWVKRGNQYKYDMIDESIQQFDESSFLHLINQSNKSRRELNEYSEVTYKIADFVVDWLINDYSVDKAEEIAKVGYDLDLDREQVEAVSKDPMYQDTTPLSMGSNECQYPSPKPVRQICSKIDERGIETYKSVVRRLRRDGYIKLAYLGGNDWRVYQSHLPNPPEAKKIKCDGTTEQQATATTDNISKVKI